MRGSNSGLFTVQTGKGNTSKPITLLIMECHHILIGTTHKHTKKKERNSNDKIHSKMTIVKNEFPRDPRSEILPALRAAAAPHICVSIRTSFSSSFSCPVFLSLRCEKPPPSSWIAVNEKTEVTSTHNPVLTINNRREVLQGKNKVRVMVGGQI